MPYNPDSLCVDLPTIATFKTAKTVRRNLSKPLVSLPWFVTPTPVPLRPQSAESYPPRWHWVSVTAPPFPAGAYYSFPAPPATPPAPRKSPFWGRFFLPAVVGWGLRWGAGRRGLHPARPNHRHGYRDTLCHARAPPAIPASLGPAVRRRAQLPKCSVHDKTPRRPPFPFSDASR